MKPLVCVKCVLCGGWLPSNKDDILLNHMSDQHRVFVNLPFILSTCFLDAEGIQQTMTFINKKISSVNEAMEHESCSEEEEVQKLTVMDSRSSLKIKSEAAPATMEELPDISHNETLGSGAETAQKRWQSPDYNSDPDPLSVASRPSSDSSYQGSRQKILDGGISVEQKVSDQPDFTVGGEVSMKSSPAVLRNYQGLELSRSSAAAVNNEEILVTEYLSEEPPVETLVDGDHPYSKLNNSLNSTFQNLHHSEKRTDLNKTSSKIIRKKIKTKSILKTSSVTSSSLNPPDVPVRKHDLKTPSVNSSSANSANSFPVNETNQRIVGYCNGAPVYMPEAWKGKSLYVKNLKYRHKKTDEGSDETDIKLDDIKEEELEEDGKPYLSRREMTRQRLRALCLEECGEKKAGEAGDYHLRVYHAGERLFPCAECPRKFKTNHKLEMHERRKHKTLSHICDVCGKHFDNVQYVIQHKKNVHLETNENLPCDICGNVYASQYRLKLHKKRHTADQQCSLCGIKMRRANYKEHLVAMHGRKDLQQHVCDICGRGFFKAIKLKEHRVIHDDARPFPCRFEDCDFASKSAGNRKKHEVNKHGRAWSNQQQSQEQKAEAES